VAFGIQVVLDAADPHALCQFWAAALHYEVEPTDEAFIRDMVAKGHAAEADTLMVNGELRWADATACTDPDGKGPRLYFQRVPEPKSVKNRVHLDLRPGPVDRFAEIARLESLGAHQLYDAQQGPHSWTTMADPEGNEFCI
jgi:hypothetical protein